MPAIHRSEFALALNQVCSERGIEPEVVLETIKAAILAAYKKDYGASVDVAVLNVDVNPDTGEAKIFQEGKDLTPPGFGRIAAQTAKQVILQRIREAEKQAVITDYSTKVGMIINGMILRFDGPNILVDIGKTEAVMPPQEQVQSERYRINQRLVFYIEGIRESFRGQEVVVSRAHEGLVKGLFKREVPEVASGAVEIKVAVREVGNRTKVAVYSSQSGVDPVGSCVGQKGVRVQAVINELNNEKIDIIQWNNDSARFIAASLSPAKDLDVKILSEKKQIAMVLVPDEQLSLAIGKEGQNARLAAKLTGWKINIKGKSEWEKEDKDKIEVEEETKEPEPKKKVREKTKKTKTKAVAKKAKKEVKKVGVKDKTDEKV
ncbi:transcription termination/antitermination protein NusA [Candidatus Gottesmanbacteria bacterium]|nr:transcription termination/antitermination protein NusA [Candidatus Gottesmanbacteria bacterium]